MRKTIYSLRKSGPSNELKLLFLKYFFRPHCTILIGYSRFSTLHIHPTLFHVRLKNWIFTNYTGWLSSESIRLHFPLPPSLWFEISTQLPFLLTFFERFHFFFFVVIFVESIRPNRPTSRVFSRQFARRPTMWPSVYRTFGKDAVKGAKSPPTPPPSHGGRSPASAPRVSDDEGTDRGVRRRDAHKLRRNKVILARTSPLIYWHANRARRHTPIAHR